MLFIKTFYKSLQKSFSEGNGPCVALDLLYSWDEVSSRISCAIISYPSSSHSFKNLWIHLLKFELITFKLKFMNTDTCFEF